MISPAIKASAVRAPWTLLVLLLAPLPLSAASGDAAATPAEVARPATSPEASPGVRKEPEGEERVPGVGSAIDPKPRKEKVRVYTNADLQTLAPIPTQARPIAYATLPGQADPGRDADWNTIMAFIDRERAYEQKRQEQGEAYALAREEMKRQQELQEQMNAGYAYGNLGYGAYPAYGGGCFGRGCDRSPLPRPSPFYFQPLPRWPLGPPTTFIDAPRMPPPVPAPRRR